MSTRIEVKCDPDQSIGHEIRTLFCREAAKTPDGKNPLTETNFNGLLEKIAQAAFDEGRRFERKHRNLSA
jgi:hypothetical protein